MRACRRLVYCALCFNFLKCSGSSTGQLSSFERQVPHVVQDSFWEHYGGEDEESREVAYDPFSRGENGGEDEEPREIAHDPRG